MSEMRTFAFESGEGKLFRDGMVQKNLQLGFTLDYEVVAGEEKLKALIKKLEEEVKEAKEAKTEGKLVEEVSAVADAAQAILKHLGVVVDNHEQHTYDEGHFVRTITLPADSEWIEHYTSQPDKFLEIMND